MTCHHTTYRASRNRFSAISFHDYLHYCGIFLAHFLMKIDRNIISSLHIVFSLCARVGWCDVCTDFTNVIKVDENVDVNEMSLLNISHAQHSRNNWQLCTWSILSPFQAVFILWTKMRIETKTVSSTWCIFDDDIILTYLRKSVIPDTDSIWIRPWPYTNDSTRSLSPGIENIHRIVYS